MEVTEWKPHPKMEENMLNLSFCYEEQSLVLVFLSEHTPAKCRITFPSPMAFRYTDELHLYIYSEAFPFMYNIAKGSAYIESFHRSSGCETLHEDVAHYAIFTWSDCYEIITMVPPQVTWEELDPNKQGKRLPPPWAKPA